MATVTNSIIIVNFNNAAALRAMLTSLNLKEAVTAEVIVVDNASPDESRQVVQRFPGVRLVTMENNRGFAPAANRGVHEAVGDVVVVCHSDIAATVHVLTDLADRVRLGQSKRVAAVLPRLIGPDRSEQPSSSHFPSLSRAVVTVFLPKARPKPFVPSLDHVQDGDWASFACAAFNRDILENVGGFDEAFYRYYAEADLCRRLHERSYRLIFAKDLTVVHGKNPGDLLPPHLVRLMRKDQMRYFQKHQPRWKQSVLSGAMKVHSWAQKD